MKTFNAAKTRSSRPGWSITFRHPLRVDTQGKRGLKVRRGLGTNDPEEADRLVSEMNQLLHDPSWWNAIRRPEAERKFSKVVVSAFFDDLHAGAASPLGLRDSFLPMPDASEGYSRVLFVGTTGAGKTTLLRQLIGSDPEVDRFPSTAPAKTTIADIEVIAGGDDYRAIVTFSTEFQVQAYVEECILDAALAAHNNLPDARVAERFLNHRDQKFRLSYILGTWSTGSQADDSFENDLDDDDDEDFESIELADDDIVTDSDRKANYEALVAIIDRIRQLAKTVTLEISTTLGVADVSITPEDQDAFLELLGEEFEKDIYSREDFHNLVQDVLDLVRSRFDILGAGEISFGASGWPQSWTFQTEDRSDFIRNIRWFSSNHWPQFGRLLTPIVDGIRLRGPLYPDFTSQHGKLVLIDGQGLGHTPDDATSLTTHISSRFGDVDVVLLVDNAQQPMQAAPLSVLKALAISGYENKLAIAFTHFDQIRGQNLPTIADRRAHVMASVMSALSSLQDTVGTRIVRSLERGMDSRCFMLSTTQKKLKGHKPKSAAYLTGQLKAMITLFEEAAKRAEFDQNTMLVYDPFGISFAVQNGASNFNKVWRARLGLATHSNLRKEHWTRVKALNKRIAGGLDNEYDTLRPVADLQTSLLEAISRYLDAPASGLDGEEGQHATTLARRLVAARLNKTIPHRLIENSRSMWQAAFDERGAGSTNRRAARIADICYRAAPIPGEVMSADSKEFLKEMSNIITSAISAAGGKLETEGDF